MKFGGSNLIPARAWLLFNTWFSLVVIFAAAAATLRIPFLLVAWPIAILTCAATGVLSIGRSSRFRNRRFFLVGGSTSLLVGLAVLVVLWGSLVKGQFLSVALDPFAYSACATYVRDPTVQLIQGAQPILHYGAALMGLRYGTEALVAMFSQISGMDICRAEVIYGVFVFFQIGVGSALFARILGASPVLSLGAGIFGVLIGWAYEIIKLGNWDQALFLSFIPFILVRIRLLTFDTSRRRGMVSLGVCLAAGIFIYPEGVALAGFIYLPTILWRLVRGDKRLRKFSKMCLAIGIAILSSSVYLPTFYFFLRGQVHAGATGMIAKGILGGLLSPRWLPAIYGLGEQVPYVSGSILGFIVGICFLGFSLVAIRVWWVKRDGIVLAVPTFLLLAIWLGGLLAYDYGLYKALTMFWPIMVAAIFVGVSHIIGRCCVWVRMSVATGFLVLLIVSIVTEYTYSRNAWWRAERKIQWFSDLQNIRKFTGSDPIRLATFDYVNQTWALFYLQGYDVTIPNPLNNLANPVLGLKTLAVNQADSTWVLTDEPRPGAVWRNKIFRLLRSQEPVEIVRTEPPNAVQNWPGDPFVWLDNQFVTFTILADRPRRVLFTVNQCLPGPDLPNDVHARLIFENNGMISEFPASADLEIPFSVEKGINILRIACSRGPSVDPEAAGEIRKRLIGLKGVAVKAVD